MNRGIFGGTLVAGALAVVLAGCGGARTEAAGPAPAAASSSAVGSGGTSSAAREADLPARDRWASPFAVATSGSATPVEPRRVLVVSADPSITAGVAEQSAIEAAIRAGDPTAGGGGVVVAESAAGGTAFLPPGTGRPEETRVILEGDPLDRSDLRIHVVETGENWRTIADEYRVNLADLLDANPRVDPVRLPVGQELVIPRD